MYILYFSAVFMFFSIAIFGGSHTRRDWLMYPNFNYLCWSYGLACLSFFFHAFAAIFLYKEAKFSYERRRIEESDHANASKSSASSRMGYALNFEITLEMLLV